MKIISISGVDGSGKSTQLARLRAQLERDGAKVRQINATTFSVAAILTCGRKRAKDGKMPDVTTASAGAIFLRKIALYIDVMRFRLWLRWLAWAHGVTHVLSDRYFYDTVVNIAYLSHAPYMPIGRALIVRPTHALFLSVDPKAIMRRARAPEQGTRYIQDKDALYRRYVQIFGMRVIDGNQPEDDVFADIVAQVSPAQTF